MRNLLSLRFVPAGLLIVFMLCGTAFAAEPAPLLLVVNQTDSTVSVVDPAMQVRVADLPEETEPTVHGHEAAVSPDGRTAYVPVYGSAGVGRPGIDGHTMLVIDLPSRKIVSTLEFGHKSRPHCAIFDPVSGLLYVTTELDKAVTVIDPGKDFRTLKIVGTIPTEREQSHMLTISKDGRRGYTANVESGTVSVLDMKARKTLTVIPVVDHASEEKHWAVQRIALSSDDKLAFTSDEVQPRLAVIDTAANKVKTWVPLPGLGYGAAATSDGRWLLVCISAEKLLAVVDLRTMKVARTIAVPGLPQEVLIRPDGKMAYISCNISGQVAAIDLEEWKVAKVIDAGKGADGLAWAR